VFQFEKKTISSVSVDDGTSEKQTRAPPATQTLRNSRHGLVELFLPRPNLVLAENPVVAMGKRFFSLSGRAIDVKLVCSRWGIAIAPFGQQCFPSVVLERNVRVPKVKAAGEPVKLEQRWENQQQQQQQQTTNNNKQQQTTTTTTTKNKAEPTEHSNAQQHHHTRHHSTNLYVVCGSDETLSLLLRHVEKEDEIVFVELLFVNHIRQPGSIEENAKDSICQIIGNHWRAENLRVSTSSQHVHREECGAHNVQPVRNRKVLKTMFRQTNKQRFQVMSNNIHTRKQHTPPQQIHNRLSSPPCCEPNCSPIWER